MMKGKTLDLRDSVEMLEDLRIKVSQFVKLLMGLMMGPTPLG